MTGGFFLFLGDHENNILIVGYQKIFPNKKICFKNSVNNFESWKVLSDGFYE